MNCQQAREKLIDLVYGELDDAEARLVREHLHMCSDCRAEFADLLLARSAVASRRRGEGDGTMLQEQLARATGGGRQVSQRSQRVRLRVRRIVTAAAGIAAAVMIAAWIWVFQERITPLAYAEKGPAEINRLDVSLTILSQPEQRPGYRYPNWTGMALVRDQRIVRRLRRGITNVSFADVPSGILPDSVRLRSLDAPAGLTILEQNYQYDLASAGAVLSRYVDKPIEVTFKDGQALRGTLLGLDDATLIITPPTEGARNVSREHVRAITFEKLPEGLLTRPTLLWQLENKAAARQQFEVAYLTGGLTWRADYVLKLTPGKKAQKTSGNPKSATATDKQVPDIIDTADLVGYATVTNNSGVTYADAQLKLLAGDVDLIRPAIELIRDEGFKFIMDGKIASVAFEEKAFFEYHLYTLGRRTTLRDAETKQIELISGAGLKLKRGYVYDRTANATAARVVSELKNSEENGLGKPLPKGVVRLYAPDDEGVQTYVAQTTIDHTPKDETLRQPWGYAFDIACSFKQTGYHRRGANRDVAWQYSLRNHKDYDVTVTVIVRVPASTYKGQCEHPWHVREVGIVEIPVSLKANSAVGVKFSFSHNALSGGGLKSPYDE